MTKEYPIYVYSTDFGRSIMFAYRMSEDEMLRTKNGLYHYDYFADACIDYLKCHYGIFKQNIYNTVFKRATYNRERGMCTVMTPKDIFFHNIFKPKSHRIRYIEPITRKYDKNLDIYGNVPFDQLIHDRYFNIVSTLFYDKLDMVCLQCFGTRAYTDEIAAANGISSNVMISIGQVLKIPLHLESILNESTIKLFHGGIVLSFKTMSDFKQAKIDSENSENQFKIIDGTLIRIGKNESHVYYKSNYIRIINNF